MDNKDQEKGLNNEESSKKGERYTFRKQTPGVVGEPAKEMTDAVDQLTETEERPAIKEQVVAVIGGSEKEPKVMNQSIETEERPAFKKQVVGVVGGSEEESNAVMNQLAKVEEPLAFKKQVVAENRTGSEQLATMAGKSGENHQATFQKQLNGKVDTAKQPKKPFAGFWMRFWAFTIDMMVVGFISNIIVTPFFLMFDISFSEQTRFSPFSVVTQIIFFSYFVLMTKFFSATLGKMILGLKVVSLEKNRLTWSSIIFRELVGRYIVTVFWFMKLTYLLVAFMPMKQGLHDLFADTSVVIERR